MSAPTTAPAAAIARQRDRRTRRPTGLPSWPILLIAGSPKAGKSWSAAEATASDLIGNTYWITFGENDPDEYSLIPGARFEIVSHDGTFWDVVAAIRWASAQPRVDGKPNLIVLDSISRVWELLSAMAQQEANARRDKKMGRNAPSDEEAQIHSDLWNRAADRWGDMVDAFRAHQGPVIVTALMDEVTVFENDKPTKNKTWKISGHKSLPGAVQAIVEMPTRGKAWLSGVVSYRMQVPERKQVQGFTVDKLWREMGLADGEVGERHHAAANTEPQVPLLLKQIASAADVLGVPREVVAAEWATSHKGERIADTDDLEGLRAVLAGLREKAEAGVSA